MLRNILDLPRSLALSSVSAALVAVLVGYSGPLLLVVQASQAAKLTDAQMSSWVWGVTIGSGVGALLLSLWYRQPVLCAWPTASVALLVTSLPQYPLNEAVGAYIVCSIALILLGMSGLFGKLMEQVPLTVIAGMMAGVLLKFGTNIFKSLLEDPLTVVLMILAYLLLKRFKFRAPSIATLIVGLAIAALSGHLYLNEIRPQLTIPQVTMPVFTWQAMLGLALPLFVLANASQNAPGIGVLRSFGYDVPANGPIGFTGLISLLTAPIGSHGVALSAITAAICVSPDAHHEKDKRYSAGVAYGFWYILFGLFGATVVALFTGLPKSVVATLAGLSLTGAISTAMTNAMSKPEERDAALLAFLLTAADIQIWGIGAPFWGLVVGMLAHWLLVERDRPIGM